MSFDPEPFSFFVNAGHWAAAFGSFLGMLFVLACLLSLASRGLSGPKLVFKWVPRFLIDVIRLSPRRAIAVMQLTFKEAVRRKALWVFGIFALLFMFGSWFLDNPNNRVDLQVKNYISFVLTAITWLVLPVVLLLSCWGLPEDIKNRSLHTVVTKPIRKTEIVIGRIMGFSALMTILIVIMGVVGFFWIDREVTYNLKVFNELVEDGGEEKLVEFVEDVNGVKVTVTVDETPTETVAPTLSALRQGNPDVHRLAELARKQAISRYLVARVPLHGYISFKGQDGNPTDRGVNTGDLWEFRTYIEGRSNWRAIWDFENVTASDQLTLESSFEAFRTHKGTINQSLLCQYVVVKVHRVAYQEPGGRYISSSEVRPAAGGRFLADVDGNETEVKPVPVLARDVSVRDNRIVLIANPNVEVHVEELERVPVPAFEISEFGENVRQIDRTISFFDDKTRKTVERDLFTDLVNDQNELRIEVACLDQGQYLGMARTDLFVKLQNQPFAKGYAKAILGIWLMLALVVVLGVTASCFLKGPIATLLTFVFLIVGQGFREFLERIVGGNVDGGGPLESIIRIVRQINLTDDLPDQPFYNVIAMIDDFLNQGLWIVKNVVPDFRHFQMAPYVANGFDVPVAQALAPSIAVTLAYLIPCLLVGYYSLSLRELEHK